MSIKKVSVFFICIGLVAAITLLKLKTPTPSKQEDIITIGSKDFTESIVLAHMMADLIEEETSIKVNRKVNLGGSSIAIKGLLDQEIHIYPEYTATILYNLYPEKIASSDTPMNRIRKALNVHALELTNLFGFNSGYELAVKREIAEKYNLETLQDLAEVAHKMTLGCDFECLDRPDGYRSLCAKYNLQFKKVKGMNRGIMFRSLDQNVVDVVIASRTEGQVQINELKILKDNKNLLPAYEAGALVHRDILQKYPEIRGALAKLEGQITEEEMRDINVKVEYEGLKTRDVAHAFLKRKGLVK